MGRGFSYGLILLLAGVSVPVSADQLLVRFKPAARRALVDPAAAHMAAGALLVDQIPRIAVDVVEVADREAALARYRKDRRVEFVEVDETAYALETPAPLVTPNDPLWAQQYGPRLINCPAAWDRTRGNAAVRIVILDTGIDLTHADLRGKVVGGRDFSGKGTVQDGNGHGTHVAGTIAAVTNNGEGVAGVVWDCPLIVGKVLADSGAGSYSSIAQGIIWAADHQAWIVSMSLGGSAESQTLQDACRYAYAKGVMLICAAGNAGAAGSSKSWPAAYAECIAVAAVDANSNRASFSSWNDDVEISAPGVAVLAPWPISLGRGSYISISGTSMATPHVAGVAALIRGARKSLTTDRVRLLLWGTARDLQTPGFDWHTGAGLLDASAAVAAAGP